LKGASGQFALTHCPFWSGVFPGGHFLCSVQGTDEHVYSLLNFFVTLPRYFQDVMAKHKMGEKVM